MTPTFSPRQIQSLPAARAPNFRGLCPLRSIFDLRHTPCTPAAAKARAKAHETRATLGFAVMAAATAQRVKKTGKNGSVGRVSCAAN